LIMLFPHHSDMLCSREMPFPRVMFSHRELHAPPPPSSHCQRSRKYHDYFRLHKFWRRQASACPIVTDRSHRLFDANRLQDGPGLQYGDALASGTPFRSVRNMTEPFPLVLLPAPASGDELPKSAPRPGSLKPTLQSFPNLHELSSQRSCEASSPKTTGLLPSPAFDNLWNEQRPEQPTKPTSLREFHTPEDHDSGQGVCYEEENIVSSYVEFKNESPLSNARSHELGDSGREVSPPVRPAIRRRDTGVVCATDLTLKFGKQRHDRTRICSSEADWLSGNMSENAMLDEWLDGIPMPSCRNTQTLECDIPGDVSHIVGLLLFY